MPQTKVLLARAVCPQFSSTTPIRTVRRTTPILDVVDLRDVVDLTVIPQSFDVRLQQQARSFVDDVDQVSC
jgi:hypothetical protein